MTDGQLVVMARSRDEMLAKQPPSDAMIALVADCWNTLSSERPIGFTVGPIPYRAVLEWCDRRPYLDAEATDAVARAINYLDSVRASAERSKNGNPAAAKQGLHSRKE